MQDDAQDKRTAGKLIKSALRGSSFTTLTGSALAAFALYACGYLIWRKRLSGLGVVPNLLFHPTFISASLCYLYYTAVIAVPCLILYSRFSSVFKIPLKDEYFAPSVLVFWLILYFLPHVLKFVYEDMFPLLHEPERWLTGLVCLYALPFYHLLPEKKKLSRDDKLHIFLAIVFLIVLFVWQDFDFHFITRTIFAFIVFFLFWNWPLPQKEAGMDQVLPLGIWGMAVLALILYHVGQFGQFEFPLLPRGIGGGKPDGAYLWTTNSEFQMFTNRPVGILMISDKEILFLPDLQKQANGCSRIIPAVSVKSIVFTNLDER